MDGGENGGSASQALEIDSGSDVPEGWGWGGPRSIRVCARGALHQVQLLLSALVLPSTMCVCGAQEDVTLCARRIETGQMQRRQEGTLSSFNSCGAFPTKTLACPTRSERSLSPARVCEAREGGRVGGHLEMLAWFLK